TKLFAGVWTGQSDDDRSDSQRGKGTVPINKDDGDGDDNDHRTDDEQKNSTQGETSRAVVDTANRVNPHRFGNCENNDDKSGVASQATHQVDLYLADRNNFCRGKIVNNGAANQEQAVSEKPKLVRGARFHFAARLIVPTSALEFFFNLGLFANLFCSLCHQ